jgi:hypothetical protein
MTDRLPMEVERLNKQQWMDVSRSTTHWVSLLQWVSLRPRWNQKVMFINADSNTPTTATITLFITSLFQVTGVIPYVFNVKFLFDCMHLLLE